MQALCRAAGAAGCPTPRPTRGPVLTLVRRLLQCRLQFSKHKVKLANRLAAVGRTGCVSQDWQCIECGTSAASIWQVVNGQCSRQGTEALNAGYAQTPVAHLSIKLPIGEERRDLLGAGGGGVEGDYRGR